MAALLEITGLRKQLDNFQLKDVNLSLEQGYIMGLLGVNGSGKTTLINTILNLYAKDAGEVCVNGFSMDKQERLAKDEIGFVLDTNMFEENLSVWHNAKSFGSLYQRYDDQLFQTFCKNFGVPLNRKVGKLSTGMKTRFQLAFALSHDAKLFIMDEPASGLDPSFRKELVHYMQEIVEDGTRSVLFSTHITEDLEPIGDFITLMKDGKVALTCSMEELRERYLIIQGSKEDIEELPFSKIIYREYGLCRNQAFLRCVKGEDYKGYHTRAPKLDELMYCLEKGGYEYV